MNRAIGCILLSAALVVAMTSSLLAAAPTTILDLRVQAINIHEVYLVWTVPSDPGGVGLGSYDVRYSTSPITEGNWDSATQATGEPTPGAPGTSEGCAVTGLQAGTLYYFAAKTSDASVPANISALSNVASDTTQPPPAPVTIRNPWLVNDRVADTHNIGTMGATYVKAYTPDGVIPPVDNEAKAINIYNNQKRRLYHWADEPPTIGGSIDDPTYTQNVFGWSLCGRHSSQATTIVNAAGLTPRRISLPGHWIYEVTYDGNNHAYDTMCTMYVYNKATPRKVASCQEMKSDTTLLANAVADGRSCAGLLLCGDTISDYQGMINGWGNSGPGVVSANWTGNMNLRTGQAFKRTWEAWQNQHPNPSTNADSMPGNDPPYHHESQHDWKDTVNYQYWEPYGQVISYIHTGKATYRRWSNGTDTLAPDFRSPTYQALLEPASTGIATYYQDGLTPDLHPSAVNVQGEAVFKINVPFYLTDASFSGDFVKTSATDVCKVYFSTTGTSWTQVYDAPVGTTTVTNQPLRTNVFHKWATWYIKIQMKGTAAKTNAGVSNFVVVTTFEHNKGAMAYLDKGVNHITLTFDNPAELQASRNRIHVVYKWKEYDGGWNVDKTFETYAASSPATFTINVGGSKVPRTEYILMELTPPPSDPIPPSPIHNLAAGTPMAGKVPLSWTATGDDANIGTAMYYSLRYSASPIADMASFNAATPVAELPAPQASGTLEQFTVTGMSTGTFYFAIVAYDDADNPSGLSNVIEVDAVADTPPATITDLAAPSAGITKNTVQLTWTAPGEDGMIGTATRYDVRYSVDPITDMATFNTAGIVAGVPTPQLAGSSQQMTAAGLAADTLWYFAIVAYDAADQPSALSNVVMVRTAPSDPPPAAVTNLVAKPGTIQRHSLTLTWTATGEDGTTGTASRYDLRYSTSPISDMTSFSAATAVTGVPAPQAAGTSEQFTVTGLTTGTTYNFALVVYDVADHASALSNMLVVTTAPAGKTGDINADGYVNVGDLQALVAAWGSNGQGGWWNWNPDADINNDGYVNVGDLQLLVANWNS